jgi:hypothetical protein
MQLAFAVAVIDCLLFPLTVPCGADDLQAGQVIASDKRPISAFAIEDSSAEMDWLFDCFNTLAVVYGKPVETPAANGMPAGISLAPAHSSVQHEQPKQPERELEQHQPAMQHQHPEATQYDQQQQQQQQQQQVPESEPPVRSNAQYQQFQEATLLDITPPQHTHDAAPSIEPSSATISLDQRPHISAATYQRDWAAFTESYVLCE